MEIGYFHHSRKVWITSRLDVVDMWSLVSKGEKVTFWCVGNEPPSQAKRKRPDSEKENEPPKKACKISQAEVQREKVKEHETELKTRHENLYSPFQYKLWAEMVAKGVHESLDTPPSVAMFNREKTPRATRGSDVMVSIIDKLTTALRHQVKKLVHQDPQHRQHYLP